MKLNSDIIAFTVCIEYSDIFKNVIDSWIKMEFKKVIVVTSNKDYKTISICKEYGFEVISIDYLRPFKWGVYRNIAINNINNDWILGMDCDTYLDFIRKIDVNTLKDNCLYGLYHGMISIDQLISLKFGFKPKIGFWFKKCMGPFQLFNLEYINKNNIRYLEHSTIVNGKGVDWHFSRNFQNILLFDEKIYCINLGERDGRISKPIFLNYIQN